MGVYINIEMPENCWSCRMFYNCYACEGHYCRCAALDEVIGRDDKVLRNKRRDDCPLVLVPKHGRLIDADKLTVSTAVPLDGKPYQYVHIDNIEDAPTIIPASEEGE